MRRRIIPDVIRNQDVLQLPGTASVFDACRAMKFRHVGCVLIAEQDRLAGIFTERDVVNRVVAEGLDPQATTLARVMTPDPDTVAPDCAPIEALRMMHDRGYRHLPVVAEGRVVAVVSRRDFHGDEKTRLEDETRYWEKI